ncbi:MAG TPA: SDR family NAD(P)-dependent oxidoreductase, partial [Magnetospirillum sp.]|nr:SDR family NAD(P)-dependent oxidoreductase [Magnetospirillum sp.]
DGAAEPAAQIRHVFAVNTGGVVNVVAPAVECMLPRGAGRIAMLGSLAGLRGLPSCPSYSASKAAVHVWGQALRGWLAPKGISVTVICPGYVKSPMSDRVVGTKPFMIPADKAARMMLDGIAKGRATVVFPRLLALGIRLLAFLPEPLALFSLRFFRLTVRPGGF